MSNLDAAVVMLITRFALPFDFLTLSNHLVRVFVFDGYFFLAALVFFVRWVSEQWINKGTRPMVVNSKASKMTR